MISIIATLLLAFAAYGFFGEGDTQAAWICLGLIGIVWTCFSWTMKDIRAWKNRRDYWANGGPCSERKAKFAEYRQETRVQKKPEVKRKWLNEAP